MAANVRVGIGGQIYPPMDAAVDSCHSVEEQRWDFIQFADQLQSTHPRRMLPAPDALAAHGGATGAYGGCWFRSFEMMAAAPVVSQLAYILFNGSGARSWN